MKAILYSYRSNHKIIIAKTMDQLTSGFGYTLETGASYKGNVNTHPATPSSLVSNLYKCNMVYGSSDSSYYALSAAQTKQMEATLTPEELNEANTNDSGLWKLITPEIFNKLAESALN